MAKCELIVAILEKEEKDLPQKRQTSDYVSNIQIGTLVAFKMKLADGDVTLSGKITGRYIKHDFSTNTSARRFKVETKNGTQYEILGDAIIWVKTGKRWPKAVFLALKGVTSLE